jgi:hypothetical protein
MDDGGQPIAEHPKSIPDLAGEDYLVALRRLHRELRPRTYLEVGTSQGNSFRLAECASVAVDPAFQITEDVIGTKPVCALYQMTSDRYFEDYDPKSVLGGPIEMAFLDGMHHCEVLLRDFINTERHCKKNAIIILHDCAPVELPIAGRIRTGSSIAPHRRDWWVGDVWRTLLALKRRRPDLRITVLDAPPSGLAIVTNLDPRSTALAGSYADIVDDMLSWSLEDIGLENFMRMIDPRPTSCLESSEAISRLFWL